MMADVDKPQPKREVGVRGWHDSVRVIYFDASADAIGDFEEFGRIHHSGGSEYQLYVDSRFDFKEVLEYVRNYG